MTRSHVTTHVLDAAAGRPAAGVAVVLAARAGAAWQTVAEGVTDADGRIGDLGPETLEPGIYQVRFDTGSYFALAGTPCFYPSVEITFELAAAAEHYHVPLLLSPFAYSTYRGS